MRTIFIFSSIILYSFTSQATIHSMFLSENNWWFYDDVTYSNNISMDLGDTIRFIPEGTTTQIHTITSVVVPTGASTFNEIWQPPADTFFQYIPQFEGGYVFEDSPFSQSHNMTGIFVVSSTVGTTSLPFVVLNIYPNPTFEKLYIDGLNSETHYTIISDQGSVVQKGITSSEINVIKLPNGNYSIIIGENEVLTRFVKN